MNNIETYILAFETLNVKSKKVFEPEQLMLLPDGKFTSKYKPKVKYSLLDLISSPVEFRISKIVQSGNSINIIYKDTEEIIKK